MALITVHAIVIPTIAVLRILIAACIAMGLASMAGTAVATPAAHAIPSPAAHPSVHAGSPRGAHKPDAAAPDAPGQSAKERTLLAIKVIGGLVALLVLAYLGGHRRVVRFQERLGISGVITAGLPVRRARRDREPAVDRRS